MSQHYRITLTRAIEHYQAGDITAKGLIHFFFKIKLAEGWRCKFTSRELSETLGLNTKAIYRALSRLQAEGSINWTVPDHTEFTITRPYQDLEEESTPPKILKPADDKTPDFSLMSKTSDRGQKCLAVDKNVPTRTDLSSQGTKLTSENFITQAQSGSDLSPYSSQITLKSLSSREKIAEREKYASPNNREESGGLTGISRLLPDLSQESAAALSKSSSVDQCSAATACPVENSKTQEFDPGLVQFVIDKVKRFPIPPNFPRKAALSMLSRDYKEIYGEYEEHLANQARKANFAPTAYDPAPIDQRLDLNEIPQTEEEKRAQSLQILNAYWRSGSETIRKQVVKRANSEGFRITANGIEEVEF